MKFDENKQEQTKAIEHWKIVEISLVLCDFLCIHFSYFFRALSEV